MADIKKESANQEVNDIIVNTRRIVYESEIIESLANV